MHPDFGSNKTALAKLIDYLKTGNTHGVWLDDAKVGDERFDPKFYDQNSKTAFHIIDNWGNICAELAALEDMLARGWELSDTNEWVYDPQHWRCEQPGDDETQITVGLDGGLFALTDEARAEL